MKVSKHKWIVNLDVLRNTRSGFLTFLSCKGAYSNVRVITKKQGQAAMEFLLTYGWVILVVVVAVSAMAYAEKWTREYCTLPNRLSCAE